MVGTAPLPIRHGMPVALLLLGTVLPGTEPTPAVEPPSGDLRIEQPCWTYGTCPAPTGESGSTEPTPPGEPPSSTTQQPPSSTATTGTTGTTATGASRPATTGPRGGAAAPPSPAGTTTASPAEPAPAAASQPTGTQEGGLPGWVGLAAFGIGALLLLLGLATRRWLSWSERRGGWSR
ncbi:hypothetical protein [Amycolatopsis aidingensis]|uniref:hypothetical protein n=1 Tax=Amycolatopsis aidingensis TaxID=2842453 RepID=UPI001C0C7970|nr:hypothetical protein [Amycolatopsis aidingensis]